MEQTENMEKTENKENNAQQTGQMQIQEEISDHPADRLLACLQEVEEQEKRLINRRSGDLKYELTNNVYPIIKQIISATLDFIDGVEVDDAEITDEQKEELKKSMKIAVENCKSIIEICNYIESSNINITEEIKNKISGVVNWAKQTIENSKQISD
jgi:DNA primase catalytic subunit